MIGIYFNHQPKLCVLACRVSDIMAWKSWIPNFQRTKTDTAFKGRLLFAKAEIIGVAFGLLAGVGSVILTLYPFPLLRPTTALVVNLSLFAFGAGFLALCFARRATPAQASTLGVRAGLNVVLVGGGLAMAYAGLPKDGWLPVIESQVLSFSHCLGSIILGAVPAISASWLSSIFLSSIIRPKSPSLDLGKDDSEFGTTKFITLPITSGFAILCLILASLIPVFNPSEAPVIAEPQQEGPPPFEYEPPEQLSNAAPRHWTIAHRKTIPDVSTALPFRVAPNSRLLAFCRNSDLTVFDLNRFVPVTTFPLQDVPERIAWSKDSGRIFVRGSSGSMAIVFALTGKVIYLPVPEGTPNPVGVPEWWDGDEIVFFSKPDQGLCYDLNQLRFRNLSSSEMWNSIRSTEPPPFNPVGLSGTSRCEITFIPEFQTYVRPLGHLVVDEWDHAWSAKLAIFERDTRTTHFFPQISLQSGHRFAPTPDGSKLIHSAGSRIEVVYFGYAQSPLQTIVAKVNPLKRSVPDEFIGHFDAGLICAYVCGPLRNPLTEDSIIGPDRRSVKAIVRLMALENGRARFWINESFQPIEESDIITDLHIWDQGKPKPVESVLTRSWATIQIKQDALSAEDAEFINNSGALDRIAQFPRTNQYGVVVYRGNYTFPTPNPNAGKPSTASSSQPETASPAPPITEAQPEPEIPAHPLLSDESISSFIRSLYKAVESRSLNLIVPFYAKELTEQARKEAAASVVRWPKYAYEFSSPFKIESTDTVNRKKVSFRIRINTQNPDDNLSVSANWFSTYEIEPHGDQLKIVSYQFQQVGNALQNQINQPLHPLVGGWTGTLRAQFGGEPFDYDLTLEIPRHLRNATVYSPDGDTHTYALQTKTNQLVLSVKNEGDPSHVRIVMTRDTDTKVRASVSQSIRRNGIVQRATFTGTLTKKP